MCDKITVKVLCENLWELERDFNLLNVEIKGVRFWELIRFKVYSELTKQLNIYGQAHTNKSRKRDKLKALMGLLKHAFTRNPLKGNYNVDFLLYDHERKMNVDGANIDIYTNEFILGSNDEKFDIIESPYLWNHITSNVEKNRKYLDHEILTVFMKKKISPIRFQEAEKKLIIELQNNINKMFNVDNFDLYTIIENHLSYFIHTYDYHKKLFEKRKPKVVFVVVSYGKIPIIAAAKDLGIKVIEFQHGVITNYHFAYNFSVPTKKLKYFPDKLLSFGEYWAKTEGFPKQTEIEIYGFPYLNSQLEKYKGTPKYKKHILFISQGTIGKKLSDFAKEIAEILQDYHIIYKLHPGEYDRWRHEYLELVKASYFENFTVIDHNKKNLYKYLSESEFQVGVSSTAIFEGLTLGCKTILIDLQGIEYMKDLIEQELVMVAKDRNDLIEKINNFNVKEFNRNYFFYEKKRGI